MSATREYVNPAAMEAGKPVLSVVAPFYRDNPVPLLETLAGQAAELEKPVEIVLFDDGRPDPDLNARVEQALESLPVPACLVTAARNVGRAAARNRLAAAARGDWLLYLDADMDVPDGFLAAYLEAIDVDDFDAAFGGYSPGPATDPRHRLHAALAATSDVHDAASRTRIGATAVCSSNLLVRASLMARTPFDDGFTGWGWEDVDWAVRADKAGRLIHLDNPARHDGWQEAPVLLAKFRDAATNYARLLGKHPELARLPGAKAARTMRALPGQQALRGLWSLLARMPAAPLRLRTLALKLWRASWAAEALS
ncbi:glycosyltransferase family 2 protein [Hyphobacterium marinum]|uniref:Glycosyltransferase n=1 Tax=Hyphobacterium marinum TaxID=3116574 RepID=A0ABU7M042_9PROT|nr:glycosyltransferase [Hyphobacterium sp. Y6023]MEE2566785.1 glycosyltransferase [Hyphobacterium sp. Y6023]